MTPRGGNAGPRESGPSPQRKNPPRSSPSRMIGRRSSSPPAPGAWGRPAQGAPPTQLDARGLRAAAERSHALKILK